MSRRCGQSSGRAGRWRGLSTICWTLPAWSGGRTAMPWKRWIWQDWCVLSVRIWRLSRNGGSGCAYRYGKEGGHILVRLQGGEQGLELSVADDGIGIAPEEQGKIFKRFYQADHSRTGAGTGLGLSMVSEIVRFHGGRVSVESVLGQGSCFVVWLPGHVGCE